MPTTLTAHAPVLASVAVALLAFGCGNPYDDGETTGTGTDSGTETADSTESSDAGTGTTESTTDTTESTTDTTEDGETATDSEGTDTSTEETDSSGGSFYAGPNLDLPPDGAEPEALFDGPQPNFPNHPARYRLPD